MKNTGIGVQLMPLMLVLASIGFYLLGAKAMCYTSFICGNLFWVVLFGNKD